MIVFKLKLVLIDAIHDFSRVPIDVFRKNRDFGPCSAALQETIREKMRRFSAILRDPEYFSLKIVAFSASGTNRPFNVVGSVPMLKIISFCKASPRRRNFVTFR